MRKFRFRLQTKLDIAVSQEKVAIEQLASKMLARDTISDELNNSLHRLKVLQKSVKNLSFQHALVVKNYLPVLRTHIEELELALFKAEEQVEIARNIVIECKRESKTLAKLREKEWSNYLHELKAREQKVIDEVAINNFFRNN